MGKTRTARFNNKRKAILDAGARALNRSGLSAFRLADVAAETGLKRPSLVYYFANAEELAEVIYSDAIDQIEARVAAAARERDPEARLRKLLDLELEHHCAERAGNAIRRPQLGELRALSSDRRRRLGRRYHAILSRVSEMLEVDQDPRRIIWRLGPAQITMEAIFWLPAWLDEYEPWMFGRVRDGMIDALLNGFTSQEAGEIPSIAIDTPRPHKTGIDPETYMRTATRLICDLGFKGGSIDRIAAQLGVTKGSFYHHLDEKNELIEACFAHSQTRLARLQQQASENGLSPRQSLSAVLLAVARIQLDGRFPLLRTSALPALSAKARARIITQSRRNYRWFATEVAAGIAAGEIRAIDPHISAQILGVSANALYDLGRFYGHEISGADARSFCALLERGILSAPQA